MPMPFVKIKNENENKIENTQINTTTKSMDEKTNNLLTSLQRKPKEIKEKNKEKEENKGFVHKLHKSKMREPGGIDMLDFGTGIIIFSLWLEVGALFAALFAGMAGSPIVVDLAVGGMVGAAFGVTIEAIGALMD